jgi:hypothetical protein
MNRYSDSPILNNSKGQRFKGTVKYPDIPLSFDDIYVYTSEGDRFDTLAQQYFNDSRLWWVLSISNPSLPQNTYYPPTGFQLRIPSNLSSIINSFEALNKI